MLHARELDYRPAAEHVAAFADEPWLAWLDSAASGDARSRCSYLCVRPFRILDAAMADPFAALHSELSRWRAEPGPSPVPFAGGAVGFLGYELGGTLETLPSRHGRRDRIPDLSFGVYDVVLAFDDVARRSWLLSTGHPETDPARQRHRAAARADEVAALLRPRPPGPLPAIPAVRWRPDLTRPEYEARVRRVLEYIHAGDIFQANFTAAVRAQRPAALRDDEIYRRLRAASPAPFGALLRCRGVSLASASPERFLRLDADGRIEARPIKGTRPRAEDAATDAALRAELAESPKDHAENLMIVDLLRNDLGRVAVMGSVSVPVLHEVESFASAHHLVSVIEARLRPGLEAVDLLRASFPGGSVTGAPKIRAMQIIDELEASRRGPYCGAIAWIGFDGAMDSSIVIRTLVLTADTMTAQAGGGIVADSDPAAEYEEMRVKLRPLVASLGGTA